jgi:6-phosphogluconate dehydrogenase
MKKNTYDFGMIGLGAMGWNLLLNIADRGFSVVGLHRDAEKVKTLEEQAGERKIKGTTSTEEFIQLLKRPRLVMLLVPAGRTVDEVIGDLLDYVEPGDVIIDGGNSYFPDTDRRQGYLSDRGVHYLGVGVSGGAGGARRGPSIMPGGGEGAYELARPIFEAVAAKVNDEPCVAYMGKGSAGHYVKMVHNGIEYGLMQLIAEAYDMLRIVVGMNNDDLHKTFLHWNQGPLNSFLIEITAEIFAKNDPLGEGRLIDKILDKAKQKGTGKWTSQNAMDLGVPIPTIDTAVTMRGLSARKDERIEASQILQIDLPRPANFSYEAFIWRVERALYFAFTTAYAQGMDLLREASREYGYDFDLAGIAKIWRGGCIIRAGLLEKIRDAYSQQPNLGNLITSEAFRDDLLNDQRYMREVVKIAVDFGIPVPAFSSALHYFDACRSADLPLNLVQAQRDYFGAHTYERNDREGTFQTEWEEG